MFQLDPQPELNPENKPDEPKHLPAVSPEPEPTGRTGGQDNTGTVPASSQYNTGRQKESNIPVETPKTIAPIVAKLLKIFNKFSLSTFLASFAKETRHFLTTWLFR